MAIKAVVFDFDGVIIDAKEADTRAGATRGYDILIVPLI